MIDNLFHVIKENQKQHIGPGNQIQKHRSALLIKIEISQI